MSIFQVNGNTVIKKSKLNKIIISHNKLKEAGKNNIFFLNNLLQRCIVQETDTNTFRVNLRSIKMFKFHNYIISK